MARVKARPGGSGVRRRGRARLERVIVAAPWLYRLVVRLVFRLPVGLPLRTMVIAHQIRSGWAAISRGDLDLMLVRYSPEVEFIADERFQALGVDSPSHGHAAARRYIQGVREAWRMWEYRLHAFVDLGDRLVTFGTQRVEGSVSGAASTDEFAQVLDLHRGLVIREWDYWSWDAALATAGFRRDDVDGLDDGTGTAAH